MNLVFKEMRQMMDHLIRGEEEVAGWVSKSKAIASVQRIPGDASTRRYYRVFAKGEPQTSYILMSMEPFEEQGMSLDFLVVQKHLASSGIDVPAVLDVDASRGFILLEDLGDVTLLRRLQEVSNADVERHLYERVIDSLVDMQVHCSPKSKPADIPVYGLFFDHKKLMWEVNFTNEHFYEKHLSRNMSDADRAIINDSFSEICNTLAAEPVVFTHRDFHSRNIMAVPKKSAKGGSDRLIMIDFQDARLGPAQYDLASLLKDSYYQLEEVQIERLINYYIARWEAVSGEQLEKEHFRYIFDLMALQRNYKAIGSFASFLNRRGNPTYLKYIGNTFENIRRTLLKYPQYSSLREVLFHYYYF